MNLTSIALLMLTCSLAHCATSRQNFNDLLHSFSSSVNDEVPSIRKRQDMCLFGANISTELSDCLQRFYNYSSQDPDSLDSFCSECGQLLHNYFVACNWTYIIESLHFLCSINEDRRRCFSILDDDTKARFYTSCLDTFYLYNGTCSDVDCGRAIQVSIDNTGCCIYTYAVYIFSEVWANYIWNTCDLPTPTVCESQFGSDAVPVYVSTLFFVTAVILAAILP